MTLAAKKISEAYPQAAPIAEDIVRVALHVGAHPYDLANLIRFESGGTFSPSIQNSVGATGLIQFFPRLTKKTLGVTTDQLARMSGPEQMRYVQEYLDIQRRGRELDSPYRLYMSVFYPAAMRWGATDPFPANVQKANPGISTPADYVRMANRYARLPTSETAPPVSALVAGADEDEGWSFLPEFPEFPSELPSWPDLLGTSKPKTTWSNQSGYSVYLTPAGQSGVRVTPGDISPGRYLAHVQLPNGQTSVLARHLNVQEGGSYVLNQSGGRWMFSLVQ